MALRADNRTTSTEEEELEMLPVIMQRAEGLGTKFRCLSLKLDSNSEPEKEPDHERKEIQGTKAMPMQAREMGRGQLCPGVGTKRNVQAKGLTTRR